MNKTDILLSIGIISLISWLFIMIGWVIVIKTGQIEYGIGVIIALSLLSLFMYSQRNGANYNI